jgi:hypothetical protein
MSRCRPMPDEFWPLLDAACDGDLAPDERVALEKYLDEYPEARRTFVDHIRLRTQIRLCRKGQRACEAGLARIESLREHPEADASEDSRPGKSPPPSPSSAAIPSIVIQSIPSIHSSVFSLNAPVGGMLFSYAVSALLVCVGMLFGWMMTITEPKSIVRNNVPVFKDSGPPLPKMVFVGRITGLVDCTFSGDRDILPPPSNSAHVPLGRKYKLDSGLMEITYDTGAKVILQGPAMFEVESASGGFLTVGRLTAKIEKREGRREKGELLINPKSPSPLFAVRTPTAVVTDLGTEFGVDVDKSGTTMSHVFRGTVKMQLAPDVAESSEQAVILGQNESAFVKRNDGQPPAIHRGNGKNAGYVRVMPPSKRVTESAAYAELVQSLHPAVYFRMESPKPDREKLKVKDSASGVFPGDLHLANEFGQPWVSGRFGESLYFRGPDVGDHIIVPDYPKAQRDQLTVSVWVMAETLAYNAMIAANWGGSNHPEPNITGQFHFGLSGQDGDLAVQMTQHDGEWMNIREGASKPLPTGVWQHVAFVADGKTVRLYRNGVEVASSPSLGIIPSPPMQSLAIGCKTEDTGKETSPNIPSFWHGRIDELAVFNAALSPEAIRRLSETPKKTAPPAESRQDK